MSVHMRACCTTLLMKGFRCCVFRTPEPELCRDYQSICISRVSLAFFYSSHTERLKLAHPAVNKNRKHNKKIILMRWERGNKHSISNVPYQMWFILTVRATLTKIHFEHGPIKQIHNIGDALVFLWHSSLKACLIAKLTMMHGRTHAHVWHIHNCRW